MRVALSCIVVSPVFALDNGVAITPPMGWLSWQKYRCSRCSDATSSNCLNERLIKDTADNMVSEGYLDAGYEYVWVDDCWQAPNRVNGSVIPDPDRFPSGMKALAAYVHSKGLKFGMYTAMGNFTCAHGSWQKDPLGLSCDYDKLPECSTAKLDVEDLVSWDIDALKVDGCGGFDKLHQNSSYAIVGDFLRDAVARRGTGPVLYHPSNLGFQFPRQFRELAGIANQWRFFNDVQPGWGSVKSIIAELGAGMPNCTDGPLPAKCMGRQRSAGSTFCASFCSERDNFLRIAGRGGWHDPDMLLVGSKCVKQTNLHVSKSLSQDEEQTNMAIWAMVSAPLMMSNDLTCVAESSKAILLNKEVIAVNQDMLGRMPFRFIMDAESDVHVWRKELVGGAVAVAIANMNDNATVPSGFKFDLRDVGFSPDTRVAVRNLYTGEDLDWQQGMFLSQAPISPHGVQLLRLSYLERPYAAASKHSFTLEI